MTFKATVQRAALQAARHAMPGIPEGAVRWREDPQKQLDAKHPNVVLSTVSLVPDGGIEVYDESPDPTEVTRTFTQRWFWTVQVRVEGWRADLTTASNPRQFATSMRFGWRTIAVGRILDDGPDTRPWQTRFPLKIVYNPDQVREVTAPVSGHMLPQYLYEVELSYVEYSVDTETFGVIESAEIQGHIGGQTVDDVVILNTDNA